MLGCSDKRCDCGSPSCQCNNNLCYYSRSYVERSSSEGWLIEDNFQFPGKLDPVKLVFGCANAETGLIYSQKADGIMGLGNDNNAFQSQLVANGIIDDVFSLCFGYPDSGVLLLGDMPLPAGTVTQYTPLLISSRGYFNVKMDAITVNGEALSVDSTQFARGYGAVLDSGTTFTYLPTDAFKAFSMAIGKVVEAKGLLKTPGADPQYDDICWKGAPSDINKLEGLFPPAEFVFDGNVRLRLTPQRYLFMTNSGSYCLGIFDNGWSGTLIGGVSVHDIFVKYDRKNMRLGFTELPCKQYPMDGAASSNGTIAQALMSPPPTPSPSPKQPPPTWRRSPKLRRPPPKPIA